MMSVARDDCTKLEFAIHAEYEDVLLTPRNTDHCALVR